MNPQFPIYVPTKGRWDTRLTLNTLEQLGVPYKAVVEAQEFDNYARAGVKAENMLVLPHRDKGLVVTRNWIWDHAQASGTPYFWTFDDNIDGFYRLHNNLKIKVLDGTILRCAEDFVQRYENIAIAGFHYAFFAKRKVALPPYMLNRRIYSNMFIKTDLKEKDNRPFRNEGFYNDDTDLCIRVMKDKWCTVLFYAFLIGKRQTMTVGGGMTPHYVGDGRRKMAEELAAKFPGIVTVEKKFANHGSQMEASGKIVYADGHVDESDRGARWQHAVDYSQFEKNYPKPKKDAIILQGVNNYGMELVQSAEFANL